MDRPIRTVIADDEALARQRIRTLLADDPALLLVGEAGDGASTAELVLAHDAELLFLDIRMPRMDGFAVLEAIGGARAAPVVIFVTAFADYAVRAFEVHAFDYLLKPFDRARFRATVERAKQQVRMRDVATIASRMSALLATLQPVSGGAAAGGAARATAGDAARRLPVRHQGRVRLVDPQNIISAEANDDEVRLHMDGEVLTTRETLRRLESRLPASFLRVHRSWIINVSRVREVQPWFGGDYIAILSDGSRVVTGRTYRRRVRELLI